MIENQTNRKVKRLRSDNGGEFCSNEFEQFLQDKGILHEHTQPYTPQENGISERINQTLQNMMRCLLIQSGLPESLWGEAIMTACFLYNRLLHSSLKLGFTSFQSLFGYKPNSDKLHVFGCKCSVYVQKKHRHKLDPRGEEGVFVGYADSQPGWRVWKNGKVIVSRDVTFFDEAQVSKIMDHIHESSPAPSQASTWCVKDNLA
jgi:hypothetical protein